jgi:hypothetical protein
MMATADDFELIDFMSYEGRKEWLIEQAARTDKLSKKEREKIKEVKATLVDHILWDRRRELERFGNRFEHAASEYHNWDLNRAVLTRADGHCEKCGRFCPENFGNALDIHHLRYPGKKKYVFAERASQRVIAHPYGRKS